MAFKTYALTTQRRHLVRPPNSTVWERLQTCETWESSPGLEELEALLRDFESGVVYLSTRDAQRLVQLVNWARSANRFMRTFAASDEHQEVTPWLLGRKAQTMGIRTKPARATTDPHEAGRG